MARAFVLVAVASGAPEYRLGSYDDDGAVAAARLGCEAQPALMCYATGDSTGARERIGGNHSGDCCAACRGRPWCSAYNFRREPRPYCELFAGAAPGLRGDTATGCVAGARRRAIAAKAPGASPSARRPNIVLLVVESTDGRTWTPGYSDGAIPLPNIRSLQDRGTSFRRHYSNAPVCCPSRATLWSGRHAHRIPHDSALGDFEVGGAWNNYEGLPPDYGARIDQVLANSTDYQIFTNGKFDWQAGGHTLNVRLDAWTTYARFPYDVNATGGWALETTCGSDGAILPGGGPNGSGSAHADDWRATRAATAWIRTAHGRGRPFFAYTGHRIVHPDYVSNAYWSEKIDRAKVDVPPWAPLMDLHPCDFQASMLKGCAPSDDDAAAFYSARRRREVRSLYYAMIAEFDAMVGAYVDAVDALEATANTVFIVTSDHGDMAMERQQFYKMAPYDASASVPMVVADGRYPRARVVETPTQLIDLFPTILDLAGVDAVSEPRRPLDGTSLAPLLAGGHLGRDAVVSQFHGDDSAVSWFLVVKATGGTTYKLIVWGTGAQHRPLLFDLDADPGERRDLAKALPAVVADLDADLRAVVDYPQVAAAVAAYDTASLRRWVNATPDWRSALDAPSLRWRSAFDRDRDASLAEFEAFLQRDPAVQPCRKSLVWPPAGPPIFQSPPSA